MVVFSEIYYPDWSVTIDGQPATLGRANYVLRALKVPAGRHHVTMEFRPASIGHTNRIAYAAQALTVLLLLGAILRHPKKANKMR